MSRKCVIMKKKPMSGHNVSHANNKTKRRFLPNLQVASFYSNLVGKNFRLRLSAKAIKTIDFKGGLDSWIMATHNSDLDDELRKIKKLVSSKQTAL